MRTFVHGVTLILAGSLNPICCSNMALALDSPATFNSWVNSEPTGSPVRVLQFSGYKWNVKMSDQPIGPGPNYFSDEPDSVWVDDEGRLHLRINYKDAHWWSAEVVSQRSFGYGTYRFHLDSPVDDLDPNAVLGMFTWHDDPAFSHREIDIEISRWGKKDNKIGQCVVQPYDRPGNLVRFAMPSGLTSSLHSFRWEPGRVFCQSLKDRNLIQESPSATIHEHTFVEDVPYPGGENARINLWLLGGRAPQNGRDLEIVIRNFKFTPLVIDANSQERE